MGQSLQFLYQEQWVSESSTYQFPPIRLVDETGALLASVTEVLLTLYDPTSADHDIISGVERANIKTGRGRVLAGILTLTLTKDDTAIIDDSKPYNQFNGLIEYTWASGAKADVISLEFIVKNLHRRPYVAP